MRMLPWNELTSILRKRPPIQSTIKLKNNQNYSLLGLDVGTKKIGLSLSDPTLQMAFPLHTLTRQPPRKSDVSRKALWASLSVVVEEYGVCGLVFGMPLLEDGSPSELGDEIYNLIESLPCIPIPIPTPSRQGPAVATASASTADSIGSTTFATSVAKSMTHTAPSTTSTSTITTTTTTSPTTMTIGATTKKMTTNNDAHMEECTVGRGKWINDLGGECVATLWSERHSTVNARRRIKAFSSKRNAVLQHKDTVAATIILQGYLDAYNGGF